MPAIIVLAALVAVYFWLHSKLSHVGQRPATVDSKPVGKRERRQ